MDVVYMVTDTVTGRKYVGSKKNWKPEKGYMGSPNCKSPKVKKYTPQQEWKQALKERPETFTFTLLECYEATTNEELLAHERRCQLERDAINSDEYINASIAGAIGYRGNIYEGLSNEEAQELKDRIRTSMLERNSKLSKEERASMWSFPGSFNPNYGNRWSDAQRSVASKRMLSYFQHHKPYRQDKTNVEMFGVEKAKEISDTLSKYASQRTGAKNPFYGKSHTEALKQKSRERMLGKKPSNTKTVSINGVQYQGLTEASKATGIKVPTLCHRIHSRNPKFKDFVYVEQAEQTPENEQETQTFSPPTLVLDPTIKNIDDFKLEHLQLQNYQSHPAIKGEVAV
jgi:hypothetical protein